MHRDRIIELCMPYGTLLPHAHVSGHKELCPTCWGGVAWAVAPPVGVVRPGLWQPRSLAKTQIGTSAPSMQHALYLFHRHQPGPVCY